MVTSPRATAERAWNIEIIEHAVLISIELAFEGDRLPEGLATCIEAAVEDAVERSLSKAL